MRNALLKVLIVVCIVVALGSLSSLFRSDEEPSEEPSGETVTQIELSDDGLIF